jgi:aryl sulfotransferase
MLERSALAEYRTWSLDSRLWSVFTPRDNDIVIATAPKCGTTWMQQIVSSLIFQDAEARPIPKVSIWVEARFRHTEAEVKKALEAQTHRRFLKTHLPFDGLPIYGQVRYIHVARDGRDAALSAHNHFSSFSKEVLDNFDRIGLSDPAVGRPYPRAASDPSRFFDQWLQAEAGPSFFHLENTYWNERERPNVLLVHYRDLKTDLDGEMRRVSDFLQIPIDETLWPSLVSAATFKTMQQAADRLMPQAKAMMSGGSGQFFNKGSVGRWREVLSLEQLAAYDRMVREQCPPALVNWLEHGRLGAAPRGGSAAA